MMAKSTKQLRSKFRQWLVFGCFLLAAAACQNAAHVSAPVVLQSAHAGTIERLLLVYTWSAELGVISLADILHALPQAEAVILSQFAPNTEAFRVFVAELTRQGLGRNAAGKPRLKFVQDANAYGPWPRDQAVVDEQGAMWVSGSDQHRLREALTTVGQEYGFAARLAAVPFTGANLLRCGNVTFCPDRIDTTALAAFMRGPFLTLPSPPAPEPFHLDLLVMPLSDKVVVVGDDALARTALLALSASEQKRLLTQWAVEYASSSHAFELTQAHGALAMQARQRPALILAPQLQEKIDLILALMAPGAFQAAVNAEPNYEWDDRIAAKLAQHGFTVIRVPFWPGAWGLTREKKSHGLPMLCYPNCLVWDEGILMPVYGIAALDSAAQNLLAQAAQKKIYPVRGGALLGYGSSGPHCLTLDFRK